MKKSLSFSFAIIALLLVAIAPVSAQVQTFIVVDQYHSGREFTFVTNGTDVISKTNVPDSTELVFENEGRVAFVAVTETDGSMSIVFRHEIPIYSLQYNDCAKTQDWTQESEAKTEKLADGVFKTLISPVSGGSFASYSCATLYKMTAVKLTDPPAMPEFFQEMDSLCNEAFFHYSRVDSLWYAYLYHQNTDGKKFAAKIIPIAGKRYLARPIGYGIATYEAFNNFCSTLVNPNRTETVATQTSDFTAVTSADLLRAYMKTYY